MRDFKLRSKQFHFEIFFYDLFPSYQAKCFYLLPSASRDVVFILSGCDPRSMSVFKLQVIIKLFRLSKLATFWGSLSRCFIAIQFCCVCPDFWLYWRLRETSESRTFQIHMRMTWLMWLLFRLSSSLMVYFNVLWFMALSVVRSMVLCCRMLFILLPGFYQSHFWP